MTATHSAAVGTRVDAPGQGAWTRASAAYTAYTLVVAALFWPTLAQMAETWLASSTYHHGAVVAPLALWMIVRLGAPPFRPSTSPLFLAAVVAAALLWLTGRAAGVNLVEQIGFVSLLIAGFGAIFGGASARRSAFPLAFLFFMVPFGDALLPHLQSFAAHGVVVLLSASGVAASLDGALLATPTQRYLIAEACAGLNFLLAATMVAALYSWLAFRRWTKMAAFLAIAVVFALAANIFRAYLVILFDVRTGGAFGIAENHIIFGWAFYGLLLLLLIMFGSRFADAPTPRKSHSNPKELARRRSGVVFVLALAILATTSAYSRFVIERAPTISLPTSLPLMSVPGWRVVDPSPEWRASIARADRTLFARYQQERLSVDVALAYFAYDRPQAEIAGFPTRAFDGRQWRRVGVRDVDVTAFGASRVASVESLENTTGQRLDAVTLYWLDGAIFTDKLSLKIRQAADKLRGRNQRGGALIIAAPAGGSATGEDAIRAFLESVEPLDEWLARIDAKLSN